MEYSWNQSGVELKASQNQAGIDWESIQNRLGIKKALVIQIFLALNGLGIYSESTWNPPDQNQNKLGIESELTQNQLGIKKGPCDTTRQFFSFDNIQNGCK